MKQNECPGLQIQLSTEHEDKRGKGVCLVYLNSSIAIHCSMGFVLLFRNCLGPNNYNPQEKREKNLYRFLIKIQ